MNSKDKFLRNEGSNWKFGNKTAMTKEVIKKHRKMISSKLYVKSKNSLTSLSLNTLINFCFFSLNSLDYIGDLSNVRDKANNGVSLRCGEISLALSKNLSYSSLGVSLINSENKVETKNKTASSVNSEYLDIVDNLDFISSNTSSGENNLMPLSYNLNIISRTSPLLIIADIKTLVSIINIYNPCLLATPCFMISPNSNAFSSVNLLLEAMAFNNLFCNSTLAICSKYLEIKSPISISLANLLASSTYSSGTLNFNSTSFIINDNVKEYLNAVIRKQDIREKLVIIEQDLEIYSYLILISLLDSSKFNKPSISSFVPVNVNVVGIVQPTRITPSSLNSQVLPSISSENFSIKSDTKGFNLDNIGGCNLITTIAGNLDGENNAVFRISLSLDNIALPSLHANEYNSEFLTPFSAYAMSAPLLERNLISLASISSSEKNLSFDIDKSLSRQSFSSIMQSCFNMFLSQRGICFENFVNRGARFKHFQYRMDHDSSAFESGLSMTNLGVCNNILIDFNSHDNDNLKEYLNFSKRGEK